MKNKPHSSSKNKIIQKEQNINRDQKLLTEYKNALDLSALVFKIDIYGYITYVNNNLLDLSGYKSSEIVGQKLDHIIQNDVSKNRMKNILKELKKSGVYKGTIKNYKKNRDYFYAEVTIVKIKDIHYKSTEYIVIANDVTNLIDARIEALNAAKAKEYFLSNMSHEIRTPLNAILGFVNLLIDENLSKKHRNYLNIILNSGENLLSIINDILDFSKLRSGEFSIEPTTFSIHDELSHAMELFVASANAKNITISSFINPDIPRELNADALRIKQILSNFLSNAIKFTPQNGVIHVEAFCDENILNISVKDNGIGIPKKDIKNIFSAFTQSKQNRFTNSDGTGLGLSICNQLVEHMNGSIDVESEVGEGSIFKVKIPVEFSSQQSKLFDDIKEFQDLKIILYAKDKKILFEHESFIKYADAFQMNVEIVENFDKEFDIALFIHEDIEENLKKDILNSDKKYIALMSKIYDDYDKYSNITSLCFPIYCSKLHSTFSELLNKKTDFLYNKKEIQKFIGNILIAEDNEANQELIKAILVKYGLSFDIAINGLEAVEFYKINNYDLILMDEQMSIMDGNEATRKIIEYEKQNSLKHTPISALTANIINEGRGQSTVYDAFLTKPIVLKELENIFLKFLKIDNNNTKLMAEKQVLLNSYITGLDSNKLHKELMLNSDELIQLVKLFIKKMATILPDLRDAIQKKDYKKISFIAHNIKGSCGNFRIETLRKYTTEIEEMANDENSKYNYMDTYNKMNEKIKEIQIVVK
jgi:PAS domain S-box-containing protein